jgi:hypothetical protein
MTAIDIDALLAAARLDDRTDRLVLADALRDAGRDGEANVLAGDGPAVLLGGEVLGAISPGLVRSEGSGIGDDDPVESYDWFDSHGGRFQMELYVEEGSHPTPAGGEAAVYRWAKWQDRYDGGRVGQGRWFWTREEAEADAARHAEEDAD